VEFFELVVVQWLDWKVQRFHKQSAIQFMLTEIERLTELKSEMFYFRETFHFREQKFQNFFEFRCAKALSVGRFSTRWIPQFSRTVLFI